MAELYLCSDCEQIYVDKPNSMCAACTQWRVDKLTEMDHEYEAWRAREVSRRLSSSQRFGEGLADVTKVIDRSNR